MGLCIINIFHIYEVYRVYYYVYFFIINITFMKCMYNNAVRNWSIILLFVYWRNNTSILNMYIGLYWELTLYYVHVQFEKREWRSHVVHKIWIWTCEWTTFFENSKTLILYVSNSKKKTIYNLWIFVYICF